MRVSILPPIQGNGVLCLHGMGVSDPCAAAVADAVGGNPNERQRPKDPKFSIVV